MRNKLFPVVLFICFVFILISCKPKNHFFSSYRTHNSTVLYSGVEQKIYFENLEDDVLFDVNGGTIDYIDSNLYIVYPDTNTSNLILKAFNDKHVEEIDFRVKPIQSLRVSVSMDTTVYGERIISAENFRTARFLMPYMLDFDHDCSFEVVRFRLTRSSKDSEKESVVITGNRINNFLAFHASSGDTYLFEDIEIKISTTNFYETGREIRSYYIMLPDVIYYIR